jgi:hypothetical protein
MAMMEAAMPMKVTARRTLHSQSLLAAPMTSWRSASPAWHPAPATRGGVRRAARCRQHLVGVG